MYHLLAFPLALGRLVLQLPIEPSDGSRRDLRKGEIVSEKGSSIIRNIIKDRVLALEKRDEFASEKGEFALENGLRSASANQTDQRWT